MNAEEKLEQLKEEGHKVYSFSKLGSFLNCEYEYYNTYIKRNRGIENIYTEMGSLIHDNLEEIYKGNRDIDTFRKNYSNKLIETDLNGVKFPNEKIGQSWQNDVGHFLNNFNKINKKMSLEKLIVFEIVPGIWMQGYIDVIFPSDKGKPYVNILDWKTSSKFSGKKLKEAGRQLLMYKLGIEATTNFKVDKVMWFMIKYIYVCSYGKTKIKRKMCNRGKWVKEVRSQLEKEMRSMNIEDFEIEMLLDESVENNNIDNLPQEIKDKYWLEDCFVEYDASKENIEELKKYVADTVNKIENKDKEDKNEWNPVEITKYNSFYCSVLCGHRKTCEFYKAFLDKNSDNFKKKTKNDDLEDLFG